MNKSKLRRTLSAICWKTGMIIVCLFGLSVCSEETTVNEPNPSEGPAPGVYNISIKVDTMKRWFKLVIPQKYDHSNPRPLLFAFHGGGNSMAIFYNNRPDLIERCEEENWILVFPNGSNIDGGNRGQSTWNSMNCCNPSLKYDVDDVGFVRRMVDSLSIMLNIDATRIYATGGSNGGMLTHKLAAEAPDIFAAVAPVSGTIGGQVDSLSPEVRVKPTQPVPIIMTHGINDKGVNYFGGKVPEGDRIDISFRESVMLWANNNQCDATQPDTTVVDGLKGKVVFVSFNDCNSNMEVVAVTVMNWGHGWPGLEKSGFDGTKTIVDFLKSHSKN